MWWVVESTTPFRPNHILTMFEQKYCTLWLVTVDHIQRLFKKGKEKTSKRAKRDGIKRKDVKGPHSRF